MRKKTTAATKSQPLASIETATLDVAIAELRQAVERTHGGVARFAQVVSVSESFESKPIWQGVVHVFDLEGHPTAKRAYAWSSLVEGSSKRRFYAVLHQGPVKSPQDAVRAAIVAEHRGQAR